LVGEDVDLARELGDLVVALADLVRRVVRADGASGEQVERHEREPGPASHRVSSAPGARERLGSGLVASGLVSAIQCVRLQRRQNSSTPSSTMRASRLPHTQRQSSAAARGEALGEMGTLMVKLKMDFDFAHLTALSRTLASEDRR